MHRDPEGSMRPPERPAGGAVCSGRLLVTGIGRTAGKKDGSFLLCVGICCCAPRRDLKAILLQRRRGPHSPGCPNTLPRGEDGEERQRRQSGVETLLVPTAERRFIVQVRKTPHFKTLNWIKLLKLTQGYMFMFMI